MAGSYMDSPAPRLAYDRDGSIGVTATMAGTLTQLTTANLQALNNEAEDTPPFSSKSMLAIIFPAPVDIHSVYLALSSTQSFTIQTSKDTTTGVDGTWSTQVAAAATYQRDVRPGYRIFSNLTLMQSGAVSQGVRGVRITTTSNVSLSVKGLHVYGSPAVGALLDRLAFWLPSTDAEVPANYFDWGNVPRGSSADKTFRIKNISGDLTANDIVLYAEALTPGTPSVVGMTSLSNDGSLFSASLDLGDLAPAALTGVLTIRRNVPTNAQVSVWSARLVADVTSWTE